MRAGGRVGARQEHGHRHAAALLRSTGGPGEARLCRGVGWAASGEDVGESPPPRLTAALTGLPRLGGRAQPQRALSAVTGVRTRGSAACVAHVHRTEWAHAPLLPPSSAKCRWRWWGKTACCSAPAYRTTSVWAAQRPATRRWSPRRRQPTRSSSSSACPRGLPRRRAGGRAGGREGMRSPACQPRPRTSCAHAPTPLPRMRRPPPHLAPPCRRRSWARAASSSAAGSGSAWRSRAPCCARHACCCWTRPPRRWTPSRRGWCRRRWSA